MPEGFNFNPSGTFISGELKRAIGQFVHHYNQERYHESLDNITPADMYYGRYHQIMERRAIIKQQTLQQRRCENLIPCT